MPLFEKGKFDGDTRGMNKGWVVGHMAKGLLHTNEVEVKWADEPRGDVGKKKWRRCQADKPGRTVSVLIHGKFKMDFRKKEGEPEETVVMEEPGSYVVFDHGVEHRSEAMADSRFLTIRWPSVEDNCKEIDE
jgi:hypothetical protein